MCPFGWMFGLRGFRQETQMMLVTYLNSHGAARAGAMIDNGARIADLAALGAAVHRPGSRDFESVLSIIEGRPTTLGGTYRLLESTDNSTSAPYDGAVLLAPVHQFRRCATACVLKSTLYKPSPRRGMSSLAIRFSTISWRAVPKLPNWAGNWARSKARISTDRMPWGRAYSQRTNCRTPMT